MGQIQLKGVTKRYPDGTEAVKSMDLEIGDGEFMILVGPSGCGKSTALRMIAGLEEITEGELLIGGEVVNDLAPRDRDIAMVFQNYALYPHMTVRENMAFPLNRPGGPRRDRCEGRDAARILDLHDHLERKPGSCRVASGSAWRWARDRARPEGVPDGRAAVQPRRKLRVQTRTEIARLQKRLGTTMVYVTHDQTEAMTLGDRVAVMRTGVLQQVGTP